MQNNSTNQPKKEDTGRSAGCFILLISLVAGYFMIIRPLVDMLNQKQHVWYSTEGVVITLIGVMFGLGLAIFGKDSLNRLFGKPDSKYLNLQITIMLVLTFAFIFGSIWAWNALLRALGYG